MLISFDQNIMSKFQLNSTFRFHVWMAISPPSSYTLISSFHSFFTLSEFLNSCSSQFIFYHSFIRSGPIPFSYSPFVFFSHPFLTFLHFPFFFFYIWVSFYAPSSFSSSSLQNFRRFTFSRAHPPPIRVF